MALLLSSRADANLTLPGSVARAPAGGPTPFAPANQAIARAQLFVQELRVQVRIAIDEGKKTATETREDLNRRFEQAKYGNVTKP